MARAPHSPPKREVTYRTLYTTERPAAKPRPKVEQQPPKPKKHVKRGPSSTRLTALGYGFAVLLVWCAFSAMRAQWLDRERLLALGRLNHRLDQPVNDFARRGTILTADGKPLADDQNRYEFQITFYRNDKDRAGKAVKRALVPSSRAFFSALSAETGIPASDFLQLATSGVQSAKWRVTLSEAKRQSVQKLAMAWKADGVSLAARGRRAYPMGFATASLVDKVVETSVADEKTGKTKTELRADNGLEHALQKILEGQDGRTVGAVDRRGEFLPTKLKDESTPRLDGQTVVTTIHSQIQEAAANSVRRAVEAHKADQGVAVVINPATGDLMAVASWPTFDPNSEQNGSIGGWPATDFNPAYQAVFEPGSTFKILTLACALELGVVKPGETFHCTGSRQVNKARTVHCAMHNGQRAHGTVTLEDAIARSCNVAASLWAERIGRDEFLKFLERLEILDRPGILSAAGVEMRGERKGLFNFEEYDRVHQLAVLGFGQAINLTPVQLASAYASLANEGVRMKPRLLTAYGDRELKPVTANRAVSPAVAETMLAYMRKVIDSERGTGKTLRIPGYALGGKTGTAQKIRKAGQAGYVSNFVGFVPAEEPEAVILVMIDNPKGGQYYGGSVAGPVFVDIAKACIRSLAIRPVSNSPRVASRQGAPTG